MPALGAPQWTSPPGPAGRRLTVRRAVSKPPRSMTCRRPGSGPADSPAPPILLPPSSRHRAGHREALSRERNGIERKRIGLLQTVSPSPCSHPGNVALGAARGPHPGAYTRVGGGARSGGLPGSGRQQPSPPEPGPELRMPGPRAYGPGDTGPGRPEPSGGAQPPGHQDGPRGSREWPSGREEGASIQGGHSRGGHTHPYTPLHPMATVSWGRPWPRRGACFPGASPGPSRPRSWAAGGGLSPGQQLSAEGRCAALPRTPWRGRCSRSWQPGWGL